MKRFSLTHLLLFVTWCAIACFPLSRYLAKVPYQGSTHDIEGYEFYHYGLDEIAITAIDEEALKESPAWHPAESNPPVGARAALAIAEQFRLERLRDKRNWQWGLDSLSLLPLDGKNNKWCWRIDFTAYVKVGGMSGRPPEFSVFVLMNGKALTPETKEYDYLEEWGIVESK